MAVLYSSFVGAVKRLLVRQSFVVVGLSGAKQSVDRAFEKTTPTFHSTVSKFISYSYTKHTRVSYSMQLTTDTQ